MLHGGEIYQGRSVRYDFSVNVNPLGIPPAAYRALRDCADALSQYPDRSCGALRGELEEYTGLSAEQILCGNGASELIEAAVRALRPGRILLTAPSFSGYLHAAAGAGVEVIYHVLRREENFALTERYLEDLEKLANLKKQADTKETTDLKKRAALKRPEDFEKPAETKGRTCGCMERPDMAILCTPSNPVGNLIDPSLLKKIVETCERLGIWLMVDECFLGFIEDEENRTMRRLLLQTGRGCCPAPDTEKMPAPTGAGQVPDAEKMPAPTGAGQTSDTEKMPARTGAGQTPDRAAVIFRYPHLLVLDAFTKRFAMPGIRLGYLMASDPQILKKIQARQPEWSVSIPAQAVGCAVLASAADYMDRARVMIAGERKKMAAFLKSLGFRVFPGEANFIFFSSETELMEPLLSKGILIRNCDNYPGLRHGDYRIAVLRPDKNDVLMQALQGIAGGR